jgi:probable F420-dependent oxidoreductase
VKIDTLFLAPPERSAEAAEILEAYGFDGLAAGETAHDPILSMLLASTTTRRVTLATSVTIAFARSPVVVASQARDLQVTTRGRFVLGLGSQVQAHIERRFGMGWSAPVPRMREYIGALRAIWECWRTGGRLDFQGEHYRHTLMAPLFSPGPSEFPDPPIYLAAVGAAMTRLAGELADGIFVHGFTNPAYLRQVTLPALSEGLQRAGRERGALTVSVPVYVVTRVNDEGFAAAERSVRGQIAFYASTAAYRGVLDALGLGDLQPALNARARMGRWDELHELVDDAMLAEFAVVGPPAAIPQLIEQRFGSLADRVCIVRPEGLPEPILVEIVSALHETPDSPGSLS